jgi:peptide/nickel transport system substrate-binding protein
MEADSTSPTTDGRWHGNRGLSTPTAAVIMIVVVALVAAGGYVAFNAIKPTNNSSQTCQPATSYVCVSLAAGHDMTLLVPFKTTQAGSQVPFTASFSKGESSSNYVFNFGDGTNKSSNNPTVSHFYSSPGSYIASVTASVNGVSHDNYQGLILITVAPSYTSSHSGSAPTVGGVVVSNSSSQAGATTVIKPAGSVTLTGSYSSSPTNPLFTSQIPTIVAPGGQITTPTSTSTTASATVLFSTSGVYTATFVGKATAGTSTVYQNFTWTVFVAPSGVSAGLSAAGGSSHSPHKGNLVNYELIPGGSTSEDPAIDYETAGYEPILNVYQTLITYNGSASGPAQSNFIPEIAACVPGSPQCNKLFNTNLTSGNDYTFVLNDQAQFYDPATSAHWGVYPSDVMFSLARTLSFATQPGFASNNGWIVGQSLLSSGNLAWDGGIHASMNNTPQHIFASMDVNNSAVCTAAMMAPPYHGCITFHANANGVAWPYFLELIADPLGSSVVPCGWFSAPAQGSGIPIWTTERTAAGADHPCLLPGGATATTDSAFQTNVSGISPTAWDTWQTAGSGTAVSGHYVGTTQWNMVGSGPYYMAHLTIAQNYLLKANPSYVQPPQCTWANCEPAAGAYPGQVSVTWEATQLPGEEAYAAGTADFASIPSTDAALLLQLIQEGKVGATTYPSLSIYFFPFALDFNVPGAQKYTTSPINIPHDFFSNSGLRSFLANAYPYTTTASTIGTKDGIQYLFNYGGAIPQFMGPYYPTNVSWPSTDPVKGSYSTAGSASWWWSALTNPGPWNDPQLASCTSANPCQWPFFGETGAPDVDQRLALWASEIFQLSNGSLKMNVLDIDFTDLVINSLVFGAGQNPMPMYTLGWAPDYPDPTDYTVALYQVESSYTKSGAVGEQTYGYPTPGIGPLNATACASKWAAFGYWSNASQTPGGIPNNCQGAAYSAMQVALKLAAKTPDGPGRVLLYNEIDHIANALALYVYYGQANVVLSYASWINGASPNSNIVIGGGGDQTWYSVTGNGVV